MRGAVASCPDTLDLRATRHTQRGWAAIQAALVAGLPMTPVAASLLTVLAYLAGPASTAHAWTGAEADPLIAIAVNFVGAWLLLAFLWHTLGYTGVARANAGSYGNLLARLLELTARYETICCRDDRSGRIARALVEKHRQAIERALERPGPQWILGSGYLAVWECMHRAEEALLLAEQAEHVVAEAEYDQARCRASTMSEDDQKALCAKLTAAIQFFRALPPQENEDRPARSAAPSAAIQVVQAVSPRDTDGDAGATAPNGDAAREAVRFARKALNQFRDERWAELVRARNTLSVMTGLTGLALYALIWLVILSAPSETTVSVSATVAAATGYFLIGATVGFLSHLRREAEQGARAAMDDYGLTFARMLVTPLLSGMAAVFGVVLIAIFAVTQTGEAGVDMPKLLGFLEIGKHPLNLVVAATFGLTPRLLMDRLHEQAEEYRKDLQGSQAVQGRGETSKTARDARGA